MQVADVTCSFAQLLHVIDEMRWLLDWRTLDPDSVDEPDLRATLDELRVCVLAHLSLMSEVVERVEYVLGEDYAGLARALGPVLDELEHFRVAMRRAFRTGDVRPADAAFERLEAAVRDLRDVEHEVLRGCGSLLFPSEMI